MVGGGGGSRPEVDGGEENVVGFGVEAHGLGTEFRFDRFGFAEFFGRVFVEDVDAAFTGGNEDEAGFGFEGRSVCAGGDGERLENFSCVGIENYEHLRIASGAEETTVLDVHGESGRG